MKSKKTTQPIVVSIVLTWNSAEFITECLNSLIASDYPTHILVIDNDSQDDTREIIRKKYPKIELVNTGSNLGYAGGNNFGIKHAQKYDPDYVFVLNPDAWVAPNCIGLLVRRLQTDNTCGIVSPIIYYDDSKLIWYAGSKINWQNGATPHNGANQKDRGQFNTTTTTDRANGCAMLIKNSAISSVGLMDENYFLYYEETDWSVQFKAQGFTIGLMPKAKVWHKASSSTGGHSSPLYHYYMTRNKLYFYTKFRSKKRVRFFIHSFTTVVIQLIMIAKNFGIQSFIRCVRADTHAYLDYFRSRFGRRSNI